MTTSYCSVSVMTSPPGWSSSCQSLDHGCERVQMRVTHRDVGEPVDLAPPFELLADLLDAAGQPVRERPQLVDGEARLRGDVLGSDLRAARDGDEVRRGLQLDVVPAAAGALADPGHLLRGLVGAGRRDAVSAQLARPVVVVDAHDVSQLAGHPQDPRCSSPDHEGWARALSRLG